MALDGHEKALIRGAIAARGIQDNHHSLNRLIDTLEDMGFWDLADKIRHEVSADYHITLSALVRPGMEWLGLEYWETAT